MSKLGLCTHLHYVCLHFEFPLTGPSALTVNITKNIESVSVIIQWDAVDDFLPTAYTIFWEDRNDQFDTVEEQTSYDRLTSYTITGLILDTVYTITVTAANRCGSGPEFRTSVILSTDTTSTTSTISPIVTASTNPMSTLTTTNPSSTTTIADTGSTTATTATTTTATIAATTTTTTTATTATTARLSAVTTTNSMTAAVSKDTGSTTKSTTSLIDPSSHLGSTIATCTTTTLIKCFGTYCYYHACTTVITNNLCAYVSVSLSIVCI